ncbi:hypothetical protein MTO96_022296 [Rhipicephalus appendiculatus]
MAAASEKGGERAAGVRVCAVAPESRAIAPPGPSPRFQGQRAAAARFGTGCRAPWRRPQTGFSTCRSPACTPQEEQVESLCQLVSAPLPACRSILLSVRLSGG